MQGKSYFDYNAEKMTTKTEATTTTTVEGYEVHEYIGINTGGYEVVPIDFTDTIKILFTKNAEKDI
jgi:hypothetical protein